MAAGVIRLGVRRRLLSHVARRRSATPVSLVAARAGRRSLIRGLVLTSFIRRNCAAIAALTNWAALGPESLDASLDLRGVVGAMLLGPRDFREVVVDAMRLAGLRVDVHSPALETGQSELQAVVTAAEVEVIGKAVEVVGGPDEASV